MKNKFGFKAGDTVKVHTKVIEGNTERIQIFDGVVIAVRPKTFIVRKNSFGVDVERIFPHDSPRVEKIEVLKKGRVRRAKLYYLRNLRGKAARIREIKEDAPSKPTPAAKKPETSPLPAAEEKTSGENTGGKQENETTEAANSK